MVALGIIGVHDTLSTYLEKKSKKESAAGLPLSITTHTNVIHGDSHNYMKTIKWICSSLDMHDPRTQRVLAFMIGTLHGIAGPGAILGVLPAVEMHSLKSSSIYLGSFVIASTLSMGTFAALYGEATKRIGSTAESVDLGVKVFSASMSLMVGLLWLTLSAFGMLDKFFH